MSARRLLSLATALLFATTLAARAADGDQDLARCVAAYVRDAAVGEDEARAVLALARAALSGGAGADPAPAVDTRGLVIGALATCHCTLATPGARAAADQLLSDLRSAMGPRRGPTPTPVGYARLVHGVTAHYEATGEIAALAFAVELQDRLDREAWREATALYGDGDGAAAATALAALDLVRLGRITDDDAFAARAARIIAAHGPGSPAPIAALAPAAAERATPILHLTLIGGADEAGTAALLGAAHRRAVPGFAIAVLDEGEPAKALRRRFPGMPLMPRLPGSAPTAYLCTDRACDVPTADPEALARRIAELAAR